MSEHVLTIKPVDDPEIERARGFCSCGQWERTYSGAKVSIGIPGSLYERRPCEWTAAEKIEADHRVHVQARAIVERAGVG